MGGERRLIASDASRRAQQHPHDQTRRENQTPLPAFRPLLRSRTGALRRLPFRRECRLELWLDLPFFAGVQFIRDIHEARKASGRPVISFEFFPPKTEEGDRTLIERTIPVLMMLKPDYCSVTYGAGGSTRDKTLMIVDRIQREHGLTAMMHLTCVNSTKEQLREVIEQARAKGIRNILALRGDPPGGTGEWKAVEGGFTYSYELVRFLRELGGFSIGTAGFPEGHIACTEGKFVDWQRLKAKVDSGADFVITQLFLIMKISWRSGITWPSWASPCRFAPESCQFSARPKSKDLPPCAGQACPPHSWQIWKNSAMTTRPPPNSGSNTPQRNARRFSAAARLAFISIL